MEFIKNIKKYILKKMYAWHRIMGIITVIPTLAWTLSGIMHPFMAHFFKPTIANEFLKPIVINANNIKWSLQQVLEQHKITEFKNFRIVSFKGSTYYQVKINLTKHLYFNTQTGMLLKNGDQKYAEFLARFFLDDDKSAIKNIKILTNFDAQYKYVNRYLPVYKVTFSRPDAVEVYVETSSSKLATFNPISRKVFIWIFDVFHNWGFLDFVGNTTRIYAIVFLLSIISLSSLSGILIYGFLWKKFKKPANRSKVGFLRKYHRTIGIYVSLLTFTFGFSGAFHALQKLEPNTLPAMVVEPTVNLSKVLLSTGQIIRKVPAVEQIHLANLHQQWYYVIAQAQQTKWYLVSNNQYKGNLDRAYAKELGSVFYLKNNSTHNNIPKIIKIKVLTDFDKREYGFVNKRLPVVQLTYQTNNRVTYYIETATGRLAAIVNDAKRVEGYSFAVLHKFLLLDWAGKTVRDLVLMIAALGVFVASVLGLVLFLKRK